MRCAQHDPSIFGGNGDRENCYTRLVLPCFVGVSQTYSATSCNDLIQNVEFWMSTTLRMNNTADYRPGLLHDNGHAIKQERAAQFQYAIHGIIDGEPEIISPAG